MSKSSNLSFEEKRKQVLDLFNGEADPTQSGQTAGSRKDGAIWKQKMKSLLDHQEFVIRTVTGKSSDNKRIDGNASERTSYHIVKFKQNPLQRGKTLVFAFNAAFEKYENHVIEDLRQQVGLLNGISPHNQILLLTKEKHYIEFLKYICEEPEDDSQEIDQNGCG